MLATYALGPLRRAFVFLGDPDVVPERTPAQKWRSYTGAAAPSRPLHPLGFATCAPSLPTVAKAEPSTFLMILSAAEQAVLECAARGLTAAETARCRQVSIETVRSQRKMVLHKLGARRIAQAVRIHDEQRAALLRTGSGPLTPGQLRAFHAKAGALDNALERERGQSKRLILESASAHFDREIASANQLSQIEASWALDELDTRLSGEA